MLGTKWLLPRYGHIALHRTGYKPNKNFSSVKALLEWVQGLMIKFMKYYITLWKLKKKETSDLENVEVT